MLALQYFGWISILFTACFCGTTLCLKIDVEQCTVYQHWPSLAAVKNSSSSSIEFPQLWGKSFLPVVTLTKLGFVSISGSPRLMESCTIFVLRSPSSINFLLSKLHYLYFNPVVILITNSDDELQHPRELRIPSPLSRIIVSRPNPSFRENFDEIWISTRHKLKFVEFNKSTGNREAFLISDLFPAINPPPRFNGRGYPAFTGFLKSATPYLKSYQYHGFRTKSAPLYILVGVMLSLLNMSSAAPTELRPSEHFSLIMIPDRNHLPSHGHLIVITFVNDVSYLYCSTSLSHSDSKGILIFFMAFDSLVWASLGVFLLCIFLVTGKLWSTFDYILALAGLPPGSERHHDKIYNGALFGFIVLNICFVSYLTADMTAPWAPDRIQQNMQLFSNGFKLFLPNSTSGLMTDRIRIYLSVQNDAHMFAKFFN